MKTIYLTEAQVRRLKEANEKKNEEVTFYEFLTNIKDFLKKLLKNPSEAQPSEMLMMFVKDKNDLIGKMKTIGLIKSKERIDEIPVEEDKHPYGKKMVAKRFITYSIPKSRFGEKVKQLYDDIIENKDIVTEEGEGGGGATTCASVMQGGGANPSAGQYDVPFGSVQRRKFWTKAMSRNDDEENKSISINNK